LLLEASERIAKLEELVAGKSEEEIAAPVKEALEKAKGKKADVDRDAGSLSAELERLNASQVSNAEVNRFTQLQGQLETLNSDIAKIEGNPFVIDRLIEEAKTEDRMREVVVREAGMGYMAPERRAFVGEICQKFLSEEFAARGIDKIKDQKEKEKAMEELVGAVSRGVSGGDNYSNIERPAYDGDKITKDMRLGLLLKNLIGEYGTLAGTVGFFEYATPKKKIKSAAPFSTNRFEDDPERTRELIRSHLGTLNLIRAYSLKAPSLDRIEWSRNSSAFDEQASKYGIRTTESGPIVPKDADKSTVEDMQRDFSKKKEEAAKVEERMTKEKIEGLNREISYLEEELKKAELFLERARRAEKVMEDLKKVDQQFGSQSGIKDKMARVDSQIYETKKKIEWAREEKSRLGPLSFIQKGKKGEEIAGLESTLSSQKAEKIRLEEAQRSLAEAENALREAGPVYKAEELVMKIKQNLSNLKMKVEAIKK
jgi:TolA-binding protein